MSRGLGNRGWTPGRPQQVGFSCQMPLLELLGDALSQETRRSCAKQNRVLTVFLVVHSEFQCLLLRGQQKEVKAQPRDFNVRQAVQNSVVSLLAWPHSFCKSSWSVDNGHGPKLNGVLLSAGCDVGRAKLCCECFPCLCTQLSPCLLRPRLQEVEAPPREKAEAQHYGEDLSNCNVGCCVGQTRVMVFSCLATRMSRLRIATMIVDRASLCCANLPCFTTQIFQCLPCLWTTKKLKLSLSMWSCPQTAALVAMPEKCVVCLVEHTDVSMSSLPVDTMEL